MPPFDASRFEPMPEVELNPKDEFWVDPDNPDYDAPRKGVGERIAAWLWPRSQP
jgi:hypothetical protein